MKTNISLILILCLLLGACKNGNASSQSKSETPQDTIKAIKMPAIPQMMTAPEQRADFLAKHYWDNVNFADTNYIHHPEVTEQAWADYCDLLNHVPLETAQQAMRNVLEAMIASPVLNETEKIRPQARLKLAQKNRIGTKALNFTYTLASGAQGSLYQLKAEYLLLFINNPGCQACTETIEGLKNAPIINQLLQEKKLILLSIYPDEELDEWKKHLSEFPNEWINGYDKKFTIKEEQVYDLKAIPTLYLLDKDKTVLLKDATAPAIEAYLMQHQ